MAQAHTVRECRRKRFPWIYNDVTTSGDRYMWALASRLRHPMAKTKNRFTYPKDFRHSQLYAIH